MSDITYSAIEAAAKSQFGIDAARLGIDHERLGQAWDDAKPAVKSAYRESVLGTVAGAAPVIEAAAWNAAADFVDAQRSEDFGDDLRQVRDRLRGVAAGIAMGVS